MGVSYSGEKTFNKICLDGVEYFYNDGGDNESLTPHFKVTGELYLCD